MKKPIHKNTHAFLSPLRTVLILLLLLFGQTTAQANDSKDGVHHVNAQEAQSLLNSNQSIQVLDVRTAREYQQGHIKGAINIDYYADDFAEQLRALDPDIEYLVHCRSGVRSGKSLPILKSIGVNKLIHLDGGIKSWLSSGLPLN